MSTIVEKRNLTAELASAFEKSASANNAKKRKALDSFLAQGLPTVKSEEYKFTPITRTLEKVIDGNEINNPGKVSTTITSVELIQGLKCNILAFVNGSFSKEKSVLLDKDINIQISDDDSSTEGGDPFDLLNQAFSRELLDISIGANKLIQHPVAIVHILDSPQFIFANPHWKCTLGRNSSISILEYSLSPETVYFNNKRCEIEVGENASLEYTIIQNGPPTDIQVNNTCIRAVTNARLSCFAFTLDGQLIRNNLTIIIDGEGVDAQLHGLYLISKNTLADNHTVVDHRKPNSHSNELYKGIMNGNARGVFNGKIYVRPDAQKTNAFQSNRNILLSESSSVYTKPQLEIWADDVKCSHGCTTGQLDEEALFYLRSRGISKETARNMLLYAFAAKTITPIKSELIQNFLQGLITEKLHIGF